MNKIQINHQREIVKLLIIVILSVSVRLLIFSPVYTPDSHRYIAQAESLLSGSGFVYEGQPVADVPPGYPIFLSIVFWVHGNEGALFAANFIMASLSCLLVYLSLRLTDMRLALIAAVAMAINPVYTKMAGYILSENLSVFLSCLIVYYLSRFHRDQDNYLTVFLVGFLCVAIVLTAPALIPLTAGIWFAAAYTLRKKIKMVAILTAGSLLLMVPWQIHCISATGNICPTVFKTSILKKSAKFEWAKTWLVHPDNLYVAIWHNTDMSYFGEIPDRAFDSPEQKDYVRRIWADNSEKNEKYFNLITAEKIDTAPFDYYLTIPLLRSIVLWAWLPQISHVQMSAIAYLSPFHIIDNLNKFGLNKTILRCGKGGVSLFVSMLHLAYPLTFLYLAFLAVRNPTLFPIFIILGVLIYTSICSYTALGEVRRNLPFIPFLLFLSYYNSPISKC